MKIAICDDEKSFLKILHNQLCELFKDKKYTIECFSSGDSLIASFTTGKYDIIILDIEMDGLNGIETAKEIRNTDRNVTIAFLTSYEDFAIEGYSVKAERYILKHQPDYMYQEQLKGLFNEYNQNHKSFNYSNNNSAFSARLSDIVFFEVYNRKIVVHTIEQDFTFYGKLIELYEQYKNDGFIKVGKSHLINAGFIKFIEKNDSVLSNGTKILLGRSIKNQVVEEYLNYLSGM